MDKTTVAEATEEASTTEQTEPVTTAPESVTSPGQPASRADSNWSRPVDRLATGAVPSSAININVDGRRLVGPVQGFGQLWQKRYEVRLDGADVTPEAVIATWKAEFGSFWPKGNRFYGLSRASPGRGRAQPGHARPPDLSTGVMVIADEESFTFMTPEGHMFASWITFSALRQDGVTVPRIEVLLRANDPLYEVGMSLGHKQRTRSGSRRSTIWPRGSASTRRRRWSRPASTRAANGTTPAISGTTPPYDRGSTARPIRLVRTARHAVTRPTPADEPPGMA
jgi:hypothetical protein